MRILTDKKTFGSYIKLKRIEKNYSQKELSELLFVTEGAISKWERGVSYPDITMISDICRVLDISEHEFITAFNDVDTRKIKHDAKKFRIISGAWFWVPTISYTIALLTCFICNLAVSQNLSWFFIVLTALLTAYSFIPTFTSFFKTKKLLVFILTSFISICLLLYTCAVYTNTLFWTLTACIGVLMGYVQLFVPILLSKSRLSRFKFTISFFMTFILTVLLLLNINSWYPLMLNSAVLITCYAFFPAIICTVICAFRLDAFIKAGICVALSTVVYYFTEYVVDILFGTNDANYQIDFNNWKQCLEGNVSFICLTSLLIVGAVLITIGIIKITKSRIDK